MLLGSWNKPVADFLGLRQQEDTRTLLWIALYFSITYFFWSIDDYIRQSTLLVSVGFVMCAYFSFAGATITHNVMHCKMFDNDVSNRILQSVLSLTYGHPVSTFVPGHNLSHHRYSSHPCHISTAIRIFLWTLATVSDPSACLCDLVRPAGSLLFPGSFWCTGTHMHVFILIFLLSYIISVVLNVVEIARATNTGTFHLVLACSHTASRYTP